MESLSFSPAVNLSEEGKWVLTMTSFEVPNSVFNITNENNSFSIPTPSYWSAEYGEELNNKLQKLSELRFENDNELCVQEVEKRGTWIEIENSGYNVAGFDHFKIELLVELKRVKNKCLEDTVYRMELTYDGIVDFLDVKYISGSAIGYTLPPGKYDDNKFILMLKSLLPNKVKVNFTIDDIRLRSKLNTNEVIRFTEESFFIPC